MNHEDGMRVVGITYPLFPLSAVRFRFYQQHSDIQWGVENFYIGPACDGHCGGHGDCLDQRCLCDPGFTGPNCYASTALKVKYDSLPQIINRQVELVSHLDVCLLSVGIAEGAF